jgi:phenylacetic acid degradation operon negative regulatory protein
MVVPQGRELRGTLGPPGTTHPRRYAHDVAVRSQVVDLPEVEFRPQSMLLTFFGDYVSDANEMVAAAGVIDLLESVGVGAYATRATLSRMVKRGLLRREAVGRQAYFGLTPVGLCTVLDGRYRTQVSDVVDRNWDGRWTFVSFSLPDAAQRERHVLRSRLSWGGFGMLQAGLWAAPRSVDVVDLLSDLQVLTHVNAFRGDPLAPSETERMVAQCYDLAVLAAGYTAFLERWQPLAATAAPDGLNPLTARILLTTDWLLMLRDDPRLPVQLLPDAWPALPALALHRALEKRLRRPAEREARRRLEVITAPSA